MKVNRNQKKFASILMSYVLARISCLSGLRVATTTLHRQNGSTGVLCISSNFMLVQSCKLQQRLYRQNGSTGRGTWEETLKTKKSYPTFHRLKKFKFLC